jgi:unsaturated rhamnogalacturonyl hydrolase
MTSYFRLIIAACCLTLTVALQAQTWTEKMASTVMTIWKDSLAMQQGRPVKWSYDQGVVLKGIEGLWKNTADKKYFDYIQKSMDFFVDKEGNIRTYKAEDYNIDNILCGRNLLMLYKVTLDPKYLKAVQTLRKQLLTHPRINAGGFLHKKIYPGQMWLDGLYMGQPFYAEYAATFHEDTAFNDIARQFSMMERFARDPKTGLLYHGYDESRQQKWANQTTGRSPHVWGRAMGWYGIALVDAIEWFPQDHPGRDTLAGILLRFADVVSKYQDKESGLWWDIIDMPKKEKNYLEASASSMFVYALAKGSRLGYLPEKYRTVAKKGYDGIVRKFVKNENGQLNFHGTVSVSGLGGNPYRDGSYDYYMSEKVVVNDPKGVGAFLQASNEIDMLPTLSIGKGKTVLLDYYFNHETRPDVTGKMIQHHYLWEQMDLNGYSLFGHAFNRYGVKTGSLKAAPTAANLRKAHIYIIVDPDSKKESKEPDFIEDMHVDAIYNWVKDGGVLLLFGNDSANAEMQGLNKLSSRFGIHFQPKSRNMVIGKQYEMGAIDIPAGNAIYKTAKKVYLKEISTMTTSGNAKAALTDKGDIIIAVSKVGKGTVFAVGDPWLYNEYTDGQRLPAAYDNYKAALDLVSWAVKQSGKK